MSLFAFAKSAGSRLFTNEEKAADEIRDHILADNPGVWALEVDYDDGVVSLGGVFDDKAAAEKCVLMAGNIKNVESVRFSKLLFREATPAAVSKQAKPAPAAEETAENAPLPGPVVVPGQNQELPAGEATVEASADDLETSDVQYYEIKSGDTLGKIAKQFYGKASAYPKIFEANREVIKDPNKIYPGQKIRIPE